MYLGLGVFGFILFGTLCFLDLYVYFIHQVKDVFFHYFKKYFSNFLLSVFSLQLPNDANVGMLEVVPEAPYTVLIFLDYFFFLLFFFLKYILLIVLLQLCPFFLTFIPLSPVPYHLHSPPLLSSCPCVIHISSLLLHLLYYS